MASENIDFKKGNGLVPVIVQDFDSRDVLMVAYMNEEAWEKTKQTGKAHYGDSFPPAWRPEPVLPVSELSRRSSSRVK